ncbi:MAG: hypothetical protein HKN24_03990, partial [Acidimicrobiales bacterium]|nr:hypothetical protein [Acidimicrobiales bacterium]
MSDRRARFVIRSMILVGVAATLIGSAAIIGARGWDGFAAHNAPLAIVWSGSIGLIAWLASRQSHSALVWVLAVSVLGNGCYPLGEAARLVLDPAGPLNIAVDSIAPADMPPRAALVASITLAIASSTSLLFNVFALLLFPNGRLPSPRWRPVALAVVAAALWSFVVNLVVWGPASTVVPEDHALWGFSTTFNLIGIPLGLLSLVIRYRGAPATEQAQIKLLLWAGCLFLPALFAGSALGDPLFLVGGSVALFGAYGVAIVRHN